jgi:hypothetical protein
MHAEKLAVQLDPHQELFLVLWFWDSFSLIVPSGFLCVLSTWDFPATHGFTITVLFVFSPCLPPCKYTYISYFWCFSKFWIFLNQKWNEAMTKIFYVFFLFIRLCIVPMNMHMIKLQLYSVDEDWRNYNTNVILMRIWNNIVTLGRVYQSLKILK